jgi:soluble lytic murein transglycosylase
MKVVPWTGLAAICLFVVTGDACAAAPPLRQQFIDEYTIARAGVPDVRPDSRELMQYAIYPYLQAARLRRDLSANGAIAAFLTEHRDEPVSITLRREWLSALAQRRDWTTFLSQYDADVDPGLTLRCHALTARLALDRTKGLEQDALEAWDTRERAGRLRSDL